MNIFTLNDSLLPSNTIPNFETLVWSERYQRDGDFKLVVEDDISVLGVLPLGALVSHTDTHAVMIVENHEVVRNSKKKLIATVSGRSFETFAENRTTLGSTLPLYDFTTGDANTEVTASAPAENVARDILRARLESGYASSNDAIPNVRVYLDIRDPDSPFEHVIQRGDVYSRALELLRIANAGIKSVRPHGAQPTLDLVIYDGLDLTDSVIFYAQNEDLLDAKYFWSIKGYRNYAQVATHTDARLYRHRDIGVTLTGLERRILYVEADDLEGDYTPGTDTDVLAGRAQGALDEHIPIVLLQAQVSDSATPKFKIHYDVGDLVTAVGEFAIAQTMRVTEHILTVDKNGIQGYPSLAAV